MDDAAAVCRGERAGELARKDEDIGDGHGSPPEAGGERLPLEPLHHEVLDPPVGPLLAPDVVEGADVRVAEGRDGLGLALEPRPAVGIGGELAGKHLDRDQAGEPGVASRPHFAHPPGAEGTDDLIGTEPLARGKAHELWIPLSGDYQFGRRCG
jgi:hypothetical protein